MLPIEKKVSCSPLYISAAEYICPNITTSPIPGKLLKILTTESIRLNCLNIKLTTAITGTIQFFKLKTKTSGK